MGLVWLSTRGRFGFTLRELAGPARWNAPRGKFLLDTSGTKQGFTENRHVSELRMTWRNSWLAFDPGGDKTYTLARIRKVSVRSKRAEQGAVVVVVSSRIFGLWSLVMRMDIQARIGIISSHAFSSRNPKPTSSSSSSTSYWTQTQKFLCSTKGSRENQENDNNNGDKSSMDWDKAWSSFRKQGKKKSFFSQFSPNKYVSWNPRRSNYPLSEEVDPIKRTERSNLMFWTSPGFTLAGAIVLVTFLLVYTILAPVK
ncbi:hypothetical protein TorRG33x02_014680 [Trema orientale]|uniref:Uncharacterized protein n=1 Tax=Trema orientale TaxID=63057 RepID=A0A2P5FXH7_TREOI|nr:hypothetical protein TorRG33x02_014680 [Trema orientale]